MESFESGMPKSEYPEAAAAMPARFEDPEKAVAVLTELHELVQ